MRPDSRSFSFTWFRGQAQEINTRYQRTRFEEEEENDENGPNLSVEPQNSKENEQDGIESVGKRSARKIMAPSSVCNIPFHPELSTKDVTPTNINGNESVSSKSNSSSSAGRASSNGSQGCSQLSTGSDSSNISVGKRFTKTVQGVKRTIGNISQRLRRSTRRRYRMSFSSPSLAGTPTRRILGRTPTKLYSPFTIETPRKNVKRLEAKTTPTGAKKHNLAIALGVDSPSNSFRNDVQDVSNSLKELNMMSRNITRRSVRF